MRLALISLLALAAACGPVSTCPPGEDLRAWMVEHNRAVSPVAIGSCASSATVDTAGPEDSSYLYTDRWVPPGETATLSATFASACDGANVAVGLLDGADLPHDRYLVSKVLAAGATERLSVARSSPGQLRLVLLAQALGPCKIGLSAVEAGP